MPIGSKALNFIAKAAPMLGAVLGTPVASVGARMIFDALGVKDGDNNALETALSSPDAVLKLRALESKNSELLAQLASADYATEVKDRMDAREKGAMWGRFPIHMAYLVTFGFFACVVMVFLPIPLEGMDRDLLSMLIGMLVSKWQTIIDFFFGSKNHLGSTKNGKGF